jgi:hypothetical protein
MLHMRLPWARAAAVVYGPSVPCRPFELAADTLFVDGDAERCSVTYRASIPLAGDHVIADLAVAAGVETAGRPLAWPANLVAEELRAIAGPESSHRGGDLVSGTLSIEDLGATRSAEGMPAPEKVLPFIADERRAPAPKTGEIPIPGAPWAGGEKPARAPVAGSPFAGTVALDERPEGIDFEGPRTRTPELEGPRTRTPELEGPRARTPEPGEGAAEAPPAKGAGAATGPKSSPTDPWMKATPAPPPAPAPKPAARPAIAPVPPEHKQSLYRKFDKS